MGKGHLNWWVTTGVAARVLETWAVHRIQGSSKAGASSAGVGKSLCPVPPPYPRPCAHGLPSAALAKPAVPPIATRWQCRSTPVAGLACGLS